jgi:hypothetical protein
MSSELIELKQYVELIASIVNSIAIVFLVYSYLISKKQIHFSTIEKCIRDFRSLENLNINSSHSEVKSYIELVNEELFYIENGFLPNSVAIEWIDGMIDFLPFVDSKKNILEKHNTFKVLSSNESIDEYLGNYPRILNFIQFNKSINLENLESKNLKIKRLERQKLTIEIINNLRICFLKKVKLKFHVKSEKTIFYIIPPLFC